MISVLLLCADDTGHSSSPVPSFRTRKGKSCLWSFLIDFIRNINFSSVSGDWSLLSITYRFICCNSVNLFLMYACNFEFGKNCLPFVSCSSVYLWTWLTQLLHNWITPLAHQHLIFLRLCSGFQINSSMVSTLLLVVPWAWNIWISCWRNPSSAKDDTSKLYDQLEGSTNTLLITLLSLRAVPCWVSLPSVLLGREWPLLEWAPLIVPFCRPSVWLLIISRPDWGWLRMECFPCTPPTMSCFSSVYLCAQSNVHC